MGYTHGRNQLRTFKFHATRTDVVAIKAIEPWAFRTVAAVILVD